MDVFTEDAGSFLGRIMKKISGSVVGHWITISDARGTTQLTVAFCWIVQNEKLTLLCAHSNRQERSILSR